MIDASGANLKWQILFCGGGHDIIFYDLEFELLSPMPTVC